MRVLVVEDEKRLAAAVRRGLQAEGFAVDLAHDGEDGLHLAREGAYDAVVLDLILPPAADREELGPDPHPVRQGRGV